MERQAMGVALDPQVIDGFIKRVVAIHLLPGEFAITVNFGGIVAFYMDRLGLPPVATSWEEIREMLDIAIKRAKASKPAEPTNLPFNIRLIGIGPAWLLLKVYMVLVYQCDSIFYVGDSVIKL
jgi:hypothetical protein